MKVKVYNLEGKEIGELSLKKEIFGIKIKPEVVHQVFKSAMNNQREPWADTKSKGEVRGGGKKPWPQKGTGRARHGSIRSPLWRGGGVIFGPRSVRNYKEKINKKMRRLATRMCLADKVKNGAFLVVENFSFSEPKSKLFAAFLSVLPKSKSYLVLTRGKDENVLRMTRNLKRVKTIRAEDVNVLDLLSKQAVLLSRDAAKNLEETLK